MSASYYDNTYLTDLRVGDKVIEHHKPTGLRYISTVKSINDDVIVVTRSLSNQDILYSTRSGMIIYSYGTRIADFYLLQYEYPTDKSPYNPGSVDPNAEELIDTSVPIENETISSLSFEDGGSYSYRNCKFTTPISTDKKINLKLVNCQLTGGNTGSGGNKCMYLTRAKSIIVDGCQFGGKVSEGTASSAGYGLDLNIYDTVVNTIRITNCDFSLTGSSPVAISIKTRLGATDHPTDIDVTKYSEGKITGEVLISGNTFATTSNKIYLGTDPKGTDTKANTSSGNFTTRISNNNTACIVYERSLYDKGVEAPGIAVPMGVTRTFG